MSFVFLNSLSSMRKFFDREKKINIYLLIKSCRLLEIPLLNKSYMATSSPFKKENIQMVREKLYIGRFCSSECLMVSWAFSNNIAYVFFDNFLSSAFGDFVPRLDGLHHDLVREYSNIHFPKAFPQHLFLLG